MSSLHSPNQDKVVNIYHNIQQKEVVCGTCQIRFCITTKLNLCLQKIHINKQENSAVCEDLKYAEYRIGC